MDRQHSLSKHLMRGGLVLTAAALLAARPAAADTLQVDGDSVTITRDAYGVPRVAAHTLRGLGYGNGYAVAQDRLAQMDLYRRTARGEMAALVGRDGLAADRETRLDGYTEAERQAQFDTLPANMRAVMTGYADGVNAYLAEVAAGRIQRTEPANYPVPFLPAAMRPWRVTDSVAVAQMMARRFGGDEGGELRNLLIFRLLKARDPKNIHRLFNDVAWRNDPSAPTTVPAADDRHAPQSRTHWTDASGKLLDGNLSFDPAAARAAMASLNQTARMELADRYGLMKKWGSYAIVVSGKRSADGHALLVGGPQMGFRTPNIACEIGLSGAGLEVRGMGFPGIPGVLIGCTPNLAWTVTSGVNDETDVFVETLDPNDPTRYRYKGQWRAMERRTEVIEVAGAEPVKVEMFRTVHGPVVQLDRTHHLAYARCSAYRDAELEMFHSLFGFYTARNTVEFARCASYATAAFNFLCATRTGDIGYWFCGRTPLRAPGVDPRLPTPGDGEHDWRGYLPFAKMPHVVNPKQGFLANWNTKPAVWWDNYDTPVWGGIWHSRRIERLLSTRRKVTTEDLRAVLVDIGTHDQDAADLLPLLAGAVRSAPGLLTARSRAAADVLLAWDRHAREGSVGKSIFDAWIGRVRSTLFQRSFGAVIPSDLYALAMQPSFIQHVLQGAASPVPAQFDYLRGRTPARIMLECLNDAVSDLRTRRGPAMQTWTYSRGQYNLKPAGNIPGTDRGTYIQIIDCDPTGFHGWSILPPGQSELATDPHFADQRDLAGWFQFKPMGIGEPAAR